MGSNDLKFIPHELKAKSFKALQRKITRIQQQTGNKITRWQIELVDGVYHYYYESAVDDSEIQRVQLHMEDDDGD